MLIGVGAGTALILLQFLIISASAMDGFAFAAEALAGQALGARQRSAPRRAAVLTSLWGLVMAGLMVLGMAVLGGSVIDLMATSPEVRAAARSFLPYVVVAVPLGWAAYMLDGIFIGATRTADMRNMMAVSFVVYVCAVWLLMPDLQNHGLWLAMLISFVARGISLALRYPALESRVG